MFCALIAAQCLLLLLFGRRAAQAASVTFQVLFAVGLVQLLFFLPDLGRALRLGGSQPRRARATVGGSADVVLRASTSNWRERAYGGTETLARLAVQVTLGRAALAAVALYAFSYSDLSQRALEGVAVRATSASLFARVARNRRLSRPVNRPLAAAVRGFTLRTLIRSRTHRMMFAVYAGFALALILSSALSIAFRNGGAGLLGARSRDDVDAARSRSSCCWSPCARSSADPVGAEGALGVPGVRAGRSRTPPSPAPATRCCCWSCCRPPLFALLQGLVFWTHRRPPSRMPRSRSCWAALLAELLVPRTGKLPFACTYFPGNSRIFALWPLYLLAFFIYTVVVRGDRSRAFAAGPASWCGSAWSRRSPRRSSSSSAAAP